MDLRAGIVGVFVVAGLAGCLAGDGDEEADDVGITEAVPGLDYTPVDPDGALQLLHESIRLAGADTGVEIYVRLVRPDVAEPLPVIAQFTPYTAPGQNAAANGFMEPMVAQATGTFDTQFARRGYVFAYADVRGTGDSSGCLDLRGAGDIADLWELTEYLGTQPWSNGKVGFIGASYPGSEAHMAALAGNPHLGAVVPVVASTSFYHYHHNDGVPYSGQHSLGGTNTGYTSEGVTPTANPEGTIAKLASQPTCPHLEHALDHGGLDQAGTYEDWWRERNLRDRAGNVSVPVLMAQGLADWNVKPDHIATWFNDLRVQKTLIAGQWGHQYPRSNTTLCGGGGGILGMGGSDAQVCDPLIPWGDWWQYAAAFFDTHLKGIDTGMFQDDVAWVQDQNGTWHRSGHWPLLADERGERTLVLTPDGDLVDTPATSDAQGPAAAALYGALGMDAGSLDWYACPHDQGTYGHFALSLVESARQDVMGWCDDEPVQELVFQSAPLGADMLVSGVPSVTLRLQSDVDFTHLVAALERITPDGEVRENYGYLNPTFRAGLDAPDPIAPGEPYTATIDFYPQEDLWKAGESVRLTVRSNDGGRTIEAYDAGTNTLLWDGEHVNLLWLPLRPAELQGVRLTEATSAGTP